MTARESRPGVTPTYLRWLYSMYEYVPAATDQNKLGVVGFWDEYLSQQDLTRFTTTIDTYLAGGAVFTVV